jgi:hypothetical protein
MRGIFFKKSSVAVSCPGLFIRRAYEQAGLTDFRMLDGHGMIGANG